MQASADVKELPDMEFLVEECLGKTAQMVVMTQKTVMVWGVL